MNRFGAVAAALRGEELADEQGSCAHRGDADEDVLLGDLVGQGLKIPLVACVDAAERFLDGFDCLARGPADDALVFVQFLIVCPGGRGAGANGDAVVAGSLRCGLELRIFGEFGCDPLDLGVGPQAGVLSAFAGG